MTVLVNKNREDYVGTGGVSSYAYQFKIFDDTELQVYRADTFGNQTLLVLNTDYTVTGAGDTAGGTVELTVALALNYSLTILRALPLTQETSFRNQGTFYPARHEDAFDRQTMIAQQLEETLGRVVVAPPSTNPGVSFQLPTPDPDHILGWNTAGTALENKTGITTDGMVDLANQVDPAKGAALIGFQGATVADKLLNVLISVKDAMFGAVGDGVTDDTAAIQACADYCRTNGLGLYADYGNYLITSQLNLRNILHIQFDGNLIVDGITGVPAVIIGHIATTGFGKYFRFNNISNSGYTERADPDLRIIGCKGSQIFTGIVPYIEIYANSTPGADESVYYNNFHFINCTYLSFYSENSGSINENRFFGGRYKKITIGSGSGNYEHNHNIFYSPVLGTATIIINYGSENKFYDVRGEGVSTVEFGEETYLNKIELSYSGSGGKQTVYEQPPWAVTDPSRSNFVIYSENSNITTIPILEYSSETFNINSSCEVPDVNNIQGGIVYAKISAWQYAFRRLIPFKRNECFLLNMAENVWRPEFEFYDASMNKLTSATDPLVLRMSGLSWDNVNNMYTIGSDIGGNYGISLYDDNIGGTDIAFVLISLMAGGTDKLITSFSLRHCMLEGDPTSQAYNIKLIKSKSLPLLSAAVSSGFVEKAGRIVSRSAGGVYVCNFALVTKTTSSNAIGATVITLESVAGIVGSENIAVLLNDGTTHYTVIYGAPTGNSVELTVPLPVAASAGNKIVTNRWV